MAVNWFEGGRRITKLCMAIAALIGGYVAFFEANEPKLEFYTASLLDEWHWRVPADPPEPADACSPSETLWAYEIKPSMQRDVRLCFDPSGKSETEIADEMVGDDFRITEARKEGYSDSEIIDYLWTLRVADFSITPAALAKIEKELPRIEREAFIDHVIEVSSITAYFIGGFWIFSFVIGWIVRGFAGIPRGQDFRPTAKIMSGS